MIHLKIEQNNNVVEYDISPLTIEKLYLLATVEGLDSNSHLEGRIQTSATFQECIDYLTNPQDNKFKDFHIDATKIWIKFYHSEIETAIINWARSLSYSSYASTGHITTDDAALIGPQWWVKMEGMNITQFNEFEKFTNVTLITVNDCFQNCSSLLSIKLPPNLTKTGGWSFNECSSLSSITIPASLTEIGQWCFLGCSSLTSLNLTNVTIVENGAFSRSGLTSANLPNVTTLGRKVFNECASLTQVTINSNVVCNNNESMFDGCSNLVTISGWKPTSLNSYTFWGCSKLETVDLSALTVIGDKPFLNCSKLDLIQNGLDFTKVTSIYGGQGAFRGTTIPFDVLLPVFRGHLNNGTTYTYKLDALFEQSAIRSISNVPNITIIGYTPFKGCDKLQVIDLSASTQLTSIDRFLVQNDSPLILKVVLPNCNFIFNSSNSWDSEFGLANSVSSLVIVCHATTPPTSNGIPLSNSPGKITVYVPDASLSAYQASSFWNVATLKTMTQYAQDFANN